MVTLVTLYSSVQFSRTVVSDTLRPHYRSKPCLPVHHQLPEFTQIHVHRVGDAIQPSHPLSPPSLTFNLSSIRVFSNESALHIRWPKYWSFSFSISLSNDYWNIRYSLLICKSLEALEHFFEICDNLKKLADKSCSLETTKRKKNLGMLWMHKTYVDTSHPYINWVIFHIKWITCWFSYYFITLVSKNFIPVRMPLSLIIWETAYQLSSQVKGF